MELIYVEARDLDVSIKLAYSEEERRRNSIIGIWLRI